MSDAPVDVYSSHLLNTPHGAVEYAVAGDGPTLLFVHGAGGGCDQARDVARRHGNRRYRVVAVSRFGYSRTPLPPHATLADQADAYACVLDALGVPSATLVAVSAGAPSALEFAVRHPERCRALVLVAPAVYPDASLAPSARNPIERYLLARLLGARLLLRAFCRMFPRVIIRSVFATPPEVVSAAEDSERSRVIEMIRELSMVIHGGGGLALDSRLTICPDMERLSCIRAPTLAISASDDLYRTLDNTRHISRIVAHTRLIAYPSGGHLLIGRESHLTAEIATFLQQHMPAQCAANDQELAAA